MTIAKKKQGSARNMRNDDGGDAFKPPVIQRQPNAATVKEGARIRLQVNATGVPRPSYSWKHNGSPISGAIGNVLVIPVARRNHQGAYICEISNCAGSVESRMVTVTVNKKEIEDNSELPTVEVSPREFEATPGESFTFTALLSFEPKNTAYQWYKDGIPIRGAIGPIFKVMNSKEKYVGSYTLVVTCGDLSVESKPAKLSLGRDKANLLPDPTNPSMTMNIADLGKVEVSGTKPDSFAELDEIKPPALPSKTKIINLSELKDDLPTLTHKIATHQESPVPYANIDATATSAHLAQDDEDDELTGGFLGADILDSDDETLMVVQEDDREATILIDPGDLDLSIVTKKEPSLTNVLDHAEQKKRRRDQSRAHSVPPAVSAETESIIETTNAPPIVAPDDATRVIRAEEMEAGDRTIILSAATMGIEEVGTEVRNPTDAPSIDNETGIQLSAAVEEPLQFEGIEQTPAAEYREPLDLSGAVEENSIRSETLAAIPENVLEIPSQIFRDLDAATEAKVEEVKQRIFDSEEGASPAELVATSMHRRKSELLRKKSALEKLAAAAEKTKRIRVA